MKLKRDIWIANPARLRIEVRWWTCDFWGGLPRECRRTSNRAWKRQKLDFWGGFPRGSRRTSNRTSNGPPGSRWAPPMGPQGGPQGSRLPGSQGVPWAPCSPRSGTRGTASGPQGPLHLGMGPGAHQGGLGVEPLSLQGVWGAEPPLGPEIPSEYGVRIANS